ncbi:MAG: glutathione S-transferase [Undibacterium sp.]|jgi:glutathione S-transferase|nr:glutathione S-transferase [Undibacterium sp.]
MLKILGKSSSINVRKVLWTCAEIGIPYDLEQWGAGMQPTNTGYFLALNPNGMVPVIQDDGATLWESNTICRYLAARHQRTDLLPAAPMARAQVEKWIDWQATELNNSWRYAFMALVRQSAAHRDPAALAAGIADWNRNMRILDAQLSTTNAYVNGATFTLADIVLGLAVHRWMAAPIDHPQLTAVAAYYQLLSDRAGFMLHGRNGLP